jgi:deoxyribonuclease-4
MSKIGAHVGGGVKGSVAKALEIQAEALQIFVGSPQTWRPPSISPEDIDTFRQDLAIHQLGPVFVHGIYLINTAAERPDVYQRSVSSLISQVTWASRVGAEGLIFHPGSAGSATYEEALTRVIPALERVLSEAEGEARVVLEVCAGQGQTIGCRFQQLADIIDGLGRHPRLAVCWDTCHLLNAGYDIASADGLEQTLEEMDRTVGLDRLIVVHANDSKKPLGSNVDRHENIGQGFIGEQAFERILNHSALSHLPYILEVPGLEGNGPDLENVGILRRLSARPLEPVGVAAGS